MKDQVGVLLETVIVHFLIYLANSITAKPRKGVLRPFEIDEKQLSAILLITHLASPSQCDA